VKTPLVGCLTQVPLICLISILESGKCLNVFGGHGGPVNCGKFNSSGNKIITGSEDQTVKIFDPKTGECLHTFTSETLSESPIHCIAAKPDDPIVFLAGTATGETFLGSIKQKKILAKIEGHEDSIESVTFCDGLSIFATSSMDGVINLWDSGNLKLRYKLEHDV
jgi:WD40 repeat protein